MAVRTRIRTSQKGYCVENDDPRFLTLDSDRNQFKVISEGVETFNLNAGNSYSYTKSVTHNLGYRPQAIAYAYYPELSGSNMVLVQKFVPLPYGYARGIDNAAIVASIDRGTSTVQFKFFQQTDFTVPEANNFTLNGMKLFYLVFVDRE